MEKVVKQTPMPEMDKEPMAPQPFSTALSWLKDGKFVARKSWDNTKYLFINKEKTGPLAGGILVKAMAAGGPPNRFNLHELDILASDWVEVTIS